MPKVTKIPATISRYAAIPIDSQQKRRVAAYARVSTDSDEQLSSYTAQMKYYTEFIKGREDWEFVKVYADEGISGCNTKKREGFKKMVEDALLGKIDLIITKSVSRFARNTVDSLITIRKLKEHNVECFFEKENIWTFDSKGELLITIMSSIAQEEARSISENVTWGQRKRMADGKVSLAYSRFLGYDKGEDGQLVINPEQAEIVKLIFGLFLEGMTPHSIANELTTRHILTPGGKTIWNQTTVKRILTNEKYKGDALLQKAFTVDFLTKKTKKNEGEVPQYYIEDHHEPIIEPSVFDMVQLEIEKRSKGSVKYSAVSIFSSKVKCSQCGGWFGAKVWHSNDKYKRVIYRCNSKYDGTQCTTPHLTEDEIKAYFVKAVNQLLDNREEIIYNIGIVQKAVCNTASLNADKDRLYEEMVMLSELVENMIAENARTATNQEEYNLRFNAITKQYDSAKERYEQVTQRIQELDVKFEQLRAFQEKLYELENVVQFDDALWGALVDFITVGNDVVVTFRDGTEIAV